MEQTVVHHLTPVIGVIEENCVNCHRCIAVCPVKYCIDGSGDTVIINHDLCIGCGSCISACSHDARTILDDTSEFREALSRGESYVAVVAPAVAANFPDQWKNLFGFLSRKGVKAFFDVGFGAELTVKTYREYMAEANPETVIAQPCPALVSYLELFRPDLLRHLAPADSPMAHTIKMVGAYFPEYAGQRIVVLSPCLAKRREFDEVAPGALNVTFKGIDQWLMDEDIDLDEFPEVDFSGPVGERAVGFSTPGGLRQTLARDVPDLVPRVRKIEGPESVYPYLDSLGESLALGVQPALVDCLNCERGCNGGPGTITAHRTIDEIEGDIRAREIQAMKDRRTEDVRVDKASRRVAKNLTDYWRPGLYARDYLDRSGSAAIGIPGDAELRDIYRRLRKTTKKDYLDCRACGYESCEQMAGAIHNGLNKPENCHHTRQWMILEEKESMRALYEGLSGELSSCNTHMNDIRRQLAAVNESVKIQSVSLEDSTEAVEQMMNTVRGLAERAVERRNALESLVVAAGDGEQDMSRSIEAIDLIAESIDRIGDMVTIINDIASRTDLLSFNAAIEAAHAGASGRGFAVVAGEIKNLAQGVGENARSVGLQLRSVRERTDAGNTTTRRAGNAIQSLIGEIRSTAEGFRNMIESTSEMAAGSGQVSQALENLKALSSSVHAATDGITETISALSSSMDRIAEKTSKNQTDIEELTSGVM